MKAAYFNLIHGVRTKKTSFSRLKKSYHPISWHAPYSWFPLNLTFSPPTVNCHLRTAFQNSAFITDIRKAKGGKADWDWEKKEEAGGGGYLLDRTEMEAIAVAPARVPAMKGIR